MRSMVVGAVAMALLFSGVACGEDDNGSDEPSNQVAQNAGDETSSPTRSTDAGTSSQPPQAASSGGPGTLTLGDEVIELDSARCLLEEQDVAGSPGKILFTAQGFGATAAGEEFILDVSRYNEDSLFTGDDIQVDVGAPGGADFYSWDGSADLGTIEMDGSTLRADGLIYRHSEDGSEVMGAFQLTC